MKKLALTAMCVGALGLVACGGGSSDDVDAGGITLTDGSVGAVDAPPATAKCNPVTNTGCMPGEKCTVITDPTTMLAVTDCAADGSVALGDPCMVDATSGVDNCVAKSLCSGGNCREICGSAPNTCGASGECSQYGGLFDDVEGAGLCSPSCDPVTQDCMGEEGCFIVLATGVATCEGQNVDGTRGEQCSGPTDSPTACWVNGCAAGHLPFLDGPAGGRALCTPFCTPLPSDSTNADANRLGDSAGTACPTVSWGGGIDSANISCRYLGSIYSNVAAGPTVGVCLDFTADYGTSGMPIGSCSAQTPGVNDPGAVAKGEMWVPGCLPGPTTATGNNNAEHRTKMRKFEGDVSILNDAIRNHEAGQQ